MSYKSILLIVGLHNQPVQISIDAPGRAGIFIPSDSIVSDQDSVSTSKSWSPGTTFELDCGYHPRVSCKDINPLAKISIPVQITFKPSYVWQIPFRRTFEVTCMDLAIIRKVASTALTLRPVGMVISLRRVL